MSGPNAGRFNRGDFTMTRVGVMQDVPNAARRRAEVAGATAEIGVAQAETAEMRRNVRVPPLSPGSTRPMPSRGLPRSINSWAA